MITYEQYAVLVDKMGEGKVITNEESFNIREYECFMNDKKYNREHTKDHMDK